MTTGAAVITPPPAPPCSDAPANPAEVIAKEPQLFTTCFGTASAHPPELDALVCGQAKVAVEIGKDGRVSRAEVATSTLPPAITACLRARLSAIQYACPGAGSATYSVPFGNPFGSGACPGG